MSIHKSNDNKKSIRCAIYARVSTEEQARKSGKEANPLTSQIETCRHFIALKKEENWIETKIYEDAGYSGKNLKRPLLQELLQDIELGLIDTIVFYKYDRLSRSPKDFYHLVEVFEKYNIIFASATQPLDTSTSAGKLMLNMLLSFAQFERELISERTISTLEQRAKDGKWRGGWIPFGYDYDFEKQTLIVNKKESEGVKLMFERWVEGKRLYEIKEEVDSKGLKNKTRTIKTKKGITKTVGGTRFDEDDVTRILKNPVYAGIIRHKEYSFKAQHKAIVPLNLFKEVEKIWSKKREKKETSPLLSKKDDHIHLLKGILRCGDCGMMMTPYPSGKKHDDGTPYLYYSCGTVSKEAKESDCKVRSLPARKFEDIIKEAISDISKNKKLLDQCIKEANKDASSGLAPLLKKQKQYQKQINQLTKEIKTFVENMKKVKTSKEIQEEYHRILEEKDKLQIQKDKIDVEVEMKQSKLLSLDIIQKGLQNFDKVINVLSLEDQKELMQLLIKEITVYPFDPSKDKLPDCHSLGVFKTKIRTKHFKVKIQLYAIPEISMGCENPKVSSDFKKVGSPGRTRTKLLIFSLVSHLF